MKPTLLIGVPRVFDRIYAGVYSKVNAGSPIKKFLFNFGYRWKLYYMNQGYAYNKVNCSMFTLRPCPNMLSLEAVM